MEDQQGDQERGISRKTTAEGILNNPFPFLPRGFWLNLKPPEDYLLAERKHS